MWERKRNMGARIGGMQELEKGGRGSWQEAAEWVLEEQGEEG